MRGALILVGYYMAKFAYAPVIISIILWYCHLPKFAFIAVISATILAYAIMGVFIANVRCRHCGSYLFRSSKAFGGFSAVNSNKSADPVSLLACTKCGRDV